MGAPASRRPLPLTPQEIILRRLKNGYSAIEAVAGLGVSWEAVDRSIRENPQYMEAYRLGNDKRLDRWARREAEREVECWFAPRTFYPRRLNRY
jgi:hypothetical protein